MQELHEEREILLGHVPGMRNPADAMTKHLAKPDYIPYMMKLYNCKPEDLMV